MPPGDARKRLIASLSSQGYDVQAVTDLEELRAALRVARADLALVVEDWELMPAFAALRNLRREAPGLPVLLLPFFKPEVSPGHQEATSVALDLLEDAQRITGAHRPDSSPQGRRRTGQRLQPFLGHSEAIRRLAVAARATLGSESPVLLEGETGSGKGVLAAWLHQHGPRARLPFVDVNCAGFSRELMDSELFGHERGAFTGAVTAKPGLIEVAEGGTLFLDEIGDMDGPIQAKLLKVIEERRFRRLGETRERQGNVRIIAATHHDLLQLVREGRFREDLYYRIGVLSLRIPPLRRRREDLRVLIIAITRSLARDLGRSVPVLTEDTQRNLTARAWPGNLRELRNTLERAMLAAGDAPIEPHHLGPAGEATPLREMEPHGGTLLELERGYIQRILDEEQNVTQAARRLGMARSTLYQKLLALGIQRSR